MVGVCLCGGGYGWFEVWYDDCLVELVCSVVYYIGEGIVIV